MFTAKDLRDDIESCLNLVAKKDSSADKDKERGRNNFLK